MRIDQYLWCVRIFKSRNIASNACKNGKIKINNQTVKPSREILPLDNFKVKKEKFWMSYKVLDIPKNRLGAKLVGLYCQETTDNEVLNQKELDRLTSKVQRDEGSGRPTKKQRREIDDYLFDKEFND
jgi:ribosome-associated heat shock protein Hsp15